MRVGLVIDGMHCEACTRRLSEAFSAVQGVTAAKVTLTPPRASIDAERDIPLGAFQAAARSAGNYTVHFEGGVDAAAGRDNSIAQPAEKKPSLYPLVLIVGYIAGTVLLVGLARSEWRAPDWHALMLDFMAGFFLVFSFFKLLDLRGFADAYQSYDVIARRSRPYALAYPFVELALGLAYVLRWNLALVNAVTLVLMLIGSLGVLKALLAKRAIRCACLGTALNLPMTTVTLVEDLVMAAMAAAALVWPHG